MTKHEKETVRRMGEIRELLAEFGLALSGYDPGVSAYIKGNPKATGNGFWDEPISFDHSEWKWLEPLLIELRRLRVKELA